MNKLAASQVDDHIGEMTVRETFDFSVRHVMDELYVCRLLRCGLSERRCPGVAPCLSCHCECSTVLDARLAPLHVSAYPLLTSVFRMSRRDARAWPTRLVR